MAAPTSPRQVFMKWHVERENRLAEIGLLLAKAPPSHERDALVVRIGRTLQAHGALCDPMLSRLDAHFAAGGAPNDFDPGIDYEAFAATDNELHEAALRLIPAPPGLAS